MGIHIHVLNASGNLDRIEKRVREQARSTIRVVKKCLPVDGVDVVVKEHEQAMSLRRIGGIGGYCPSPHYVELALDLRVKKLLTHLEQLVGRSLAHELHHAARWSSGQFPKRFFGHIISEGLADVFAEEITGIPPKWTTSLSQADFNRLLPRARREFDRTTFSYEDWFIRGSKKRNIPIWAGYAIGYRLIRQYLKEHPDESAASLYHKPDRSFR